MNVEILNYVEQMEAALLSDLVTTDTSNLYAIATTMIKNEDSAFKEICQAYEVVKHELLG